LRFRDVAIQIEAQTLTIPGATDVGFAAEPTDRQTDTVEKRLQFAVIEAGGTARKMRGKKR
jgi:hypothetical protein